VTGASDTILIRNVAVRGRSACDVRLDSRTILAVEPSLTLRRGERVLDGAGGALIPGLHDHHVHLRALVASRQSVDVSAAVSPADFDHIVAEAAVAAAPQSAAVSTAGAAAGAAPDRWLRVVGWDEHSCGPLDRYRLDALAGTVPVRVQHRSGAMWILNSVAVQRTGADDCDLPGAERDASGMPTGRLLRLDTWLRERLAAGSPDAFAAGLAEFAVASARIGVTGFTDATPGRDQADIRAFAQLAADGTVPQRLVLMAPPTLPGSVADENGGALSPVTGRVTLGPMKLMLDDVTLPGSVEMAETIALAHRSGSAVAVHCVTTEQLVVTVAAFEEAGTAAGDRIEHGSIVPPGYAARLASLGLAVVTQPGFIAARGQDYLRDVAAAEQRWLYPCRSLLRAGVAVAGGTDAPFGPTDPWLCIASAILRRTAGGQILGPDERISPRRALGLFLASAQDVRRLRTITPGQPADVCLLHLPLAAVLAKPDASMVRAVIAGGCVFGAAVG
jgi:predicted amidohydrolase YtcJ